MAAREAAVQREDAAKGTGDKRNAAVFRKVADEAARELEDRALAVATRSVLKEGAQVERDAAALPSQVMTG